MLSVTIAAELVLHGLCFPHKGNCPISIYQLPTDTWLKISIPVGSMFQGIQFILSKKVYKGK